VTIADIYKTIDLDGKVVCIYVVLIILRYITDMSLFGGFMRSLTGVLSRNGNRIK